MKIISIISENFFEEGEIRFCSERRMIAGSPVDSCRIILDYGESGANFDITHKTLTRHSHQPITQNIQIKTVDPPDTGSSVFDLDLGEVRPRDEIQITGYLQMYNFITLEHNPKANSPLSLKTQTINKLKIIIY